MVLDVNFIFPEFVINLGAPLQEFVEENPLNVILSSLKLILDNYMLNISTCTLLAVSFKIGRIFWKNICQHKLLGTIDQHVFQMFMIFFLHKNQS